MTHSFTLNDLFEGQVLKNPDKVAITLNNKKLSYVELNKKANQLASYLVNQGVKPQQPIVVCMDRSFEFFIAILGILKVGGAYIPLDPNQPNQRLFNIVKESDTPMVLTTSNWSKKFQTCGVKVLVLNKLCLAKENSNNLKLKLPPTNLAYIIFTSGSTGKPKGVLIEHFSLINYALWFSNELLQGDDDIIDCSSNISFDFALTLTLVPLLLGLSIVICEDKIKQDPRRYLAHLKDHRISLIKITPSFFRVLFFELENTYTHLNHLKKIMLGGENLATIDCKNWLNLYPQHRLYNEYGPTETTVAVSIFKVDKKNIDSLNENVPIGFLIPNTQAYILNEQHKPVASNETGELYLGGLCLARGYLNNKNLTNNYFINNPYDPKTKLYRTGDLCRRLPNGNLECFGRIDQQLKIRGFRVELEEIEHQLLKHPAIKNVAVIALDKGKEKKLIAYYLLKNSYKKIAIKSLRLFLQEYLPDYMLPSIFVLMEDFPLNANGKLDRNALPLPDYQTHTPFKAAKTLLERKLCKIWSEELGITNIGINDNFFELGGHSLSAARIISKINSKLQRNLSLQNFYQALTIAQLKKIIQKSKKIRKHNPIIQKYLNRKNLPLSDFQFMLWLSDAFEPKAKKLNIFTRKRILGHLDINRLNSAFSCLLKKHQLLSYRISRYHPHHNLQTYQEFKVVEQNLALLSETESEKIMESSSEQLRNLHPWPKNKPQILTHVFHLKNNTTELQITLPHMIADDLCPEILLKDLSEFYQQSLNEVVPEKNFYQEYIADEQHYFEQHLNEDLQFWENYLGDAQLCRFPENSIIRDMQKENLAYSNYTLIPENIYQDLKEYCAYNQLSILDGLCSVLVKALIQCLPGQNHHPVAINRVKSTRDQEEYDSSIGCFLRLDPIKLDFKHNVNLDLIAQAIHEQVVLTTPHQKCSNLVKLASLHNFRKHRNLIKESLIKLGGKLYSTLTGLNINPMILSLTSRLNTVKGPHFLINVNVHNNFIETQNPSEIKDIFGMKLKKLPLTTSDLLQIDNLLDVCFLRINSEPYLVLSANLSDEFKQNLAQAMLEIINKLR